MRGLLSPEGYSGRWARGGLHISMEAHLHEPPARPCPFCPLVFPRLFPFHNVCQLKVAPQICSDVLAQAARQPPVCLKCSQPREKQMLNPEWSKRGEGGDPGEGLDTAFLSWGRSAHPKSHPKIALPPGSGKTCSPYFSFNTDLLSKYILIMLSTQHGGILSCFFCAAQEFPQLF